MQKTLELSTVNIHIFTMIVLNERGKSWGVQSHLVARIPLKIQTLNNNDPYCTLPSTCRVGARSPFLFIDRYISARRAGTKQRSYKSSKTHILVLAPSLYSSNTHRIVVPNHVTRKEAHSTFGLFDTPSLSYILNHSSTSGCEYWNDLVTSSALKSSFDSL